MSCSHAGDLRLFEAHLAAHDSATEALRLWCGKQGISANPAITAQPAGGRANPPTRLRQQLALAEGDSPGYRHVRLSCNGTVLSEAHNWFVPARLTPEMNRILAETDTPFGKVVAPLRFTRQSLAIQSGRGEGCPAETISTHRALLRLPDGKPLAMVVECYTAANVQR